MASISKKSMRTKRGGIAQMVERAQVTARDGMGPVVLAPIVLHVLRLERRRVKRIIEAQPRWKPIGMMVPRSDGAWLHRNDILAALKETP